MHHSRTAGWTNGYCYKVRQLLSKHGFRDVWLLQTHLYFHHVFSRRITDEFIQDWQSNMSSSFNRKLDTYALLKKTYVFEKYLTYGLAKPCRVLLTKLRISNHSLEVERGRYAKPVIPRDLRFCNCCMNEIGDECHFVMFCTCNAELRKQLFTSLNITITSSNNQSVFKELHVLKCNSYHATRMFAKFVYASFKRKEAVSQAG